MSVQLRLISCFFVVLFANSQEIKSRLIPDQIRQTVINRVNEGIYPGVVIGMIDSSQSEFFCYGYKSVAGKDMVDEQTIFEIGSVTKTFTGVLFAEMILRGEVKANDRLQDYLPARAHAPSYNRKHIRLINLVNHSSSLPHNPTNWPSPYTGTYKTDLLYDFLNGYQLDHPIGSRYEYSNLGIGLLGHVLALKLKTDFEHLLIERILDPLKMNSTRITLTDSMYSHLARGYDQNLKEVANLELIALDAAGGLRSSAADLLHYLAANMGLEQSNLYQAMQLSHEITFAASDSQKIGMGWQRFISPNTDIVWHNGNTLGYSCYLGFTADKQRGVVILCNSENRIDDIGKRLLQANLNFEE
ncbi:MAG: serine hydrolase [Calditrichaeota bacterium]|nr:serine hydrolase [Calditrichota bacterium]